MGATSSRDRKWIFSLTPSRAPDLPALSLSRPPDLARSRLHRDVLFRSDQKNLGLLHHGDEKAISTCQLVTEFRLL